MVWAVDEGVRPRFGFLEVALVEFLARLLQVGKTGDSQTEEAPAEDRLLAVVLHRRFRYVQAQSTPGTACPERSQRQRTLARLCGAVHGVGFILVSSLVSLLFRVLVDVFLGDDFR